MRFWKVNQAEFEAKMAEIHPSLTSQQILEISCTTNDGCFFLTYPGEAEGEEIQPGEVRAKIESGEIIRPDLDTLFI